MYFAAFIDVSNQRLDEIDPRDSPKHYVALGDSAEMDVIIKAGLFYLLDHAWAC